MPIETGTTILQLDSLWPLSGDKVAQGDNHLRLIKHVLKNQFPGIGGLGLSRATVATEDEFDTLTGVTSSIQDQLDELKKKADDMVETIGNAFFPVGGMLITTTSALPSSYGYPGTWSLISEDCSLNSLPSGSLKGGTISGVNDVDVVLPEHTHGMSHKHTRGDMNITGNFIPVCTRRSLPGGAFAVEYSIPLYIETYKTNNGFYNFTTTFNANKAWTGSTSEPTNSRTADEGISSATMNVTGKVINVFIWKRVS